ncbi:MAG: phosphate ABC transporter permease subunit PstC, partial [Synergistaceae bacterium]
MSRVVFSVSMAGILLMVFILGFLVYNGLPVIKESGFREIFTSMDWYPVEEPPALGMVSLIAGTFAATILSSLLALP